MVCYYCKKFDRSSPVFLCRQAILVMSTVGCKSISSTVVAMSVHFSLCLATLFLLPSLESADTENIKKRKCL